MIKCNAELFRIATLCQSKEESRYYLCGVFIEPHAVQGVTLTTTDGHRLISIHDEHGSADESAIISLSPAALKECKAGKFSKRLLVIDGLNAAIHEVSDDGTLGDIVAVSPKCKIDGCFPDYRQVIPTIKGTTAPPHFDGTLWPTFAAIAIALNKEKGSSAKPLVRFVSEDPRSPALVLFSNDERAFGVLMPVSGSDNGFQPPAWFFATRPAPALQAAE